MNGDTAETRLSVSFMPSVLSLVDILARERATSEAELIHTAITRMLNSSDAVGDTFVQVGARDVDTRRSGVVSGDFDPLAGIAVPRGVRPRFTRLADIYIDKPTLVRLVDFCRRAKLSRAWAIRMAVDRFLFDEVANTGLGMLKVSGGATAAD